MTTAFLPGGVGFSGGYVLGGDDEDEPWLVNTNGLTATMIST